MRWVSTAAQVRELDRRVIEDLGLPGIALMELAARGVADAIRRHHAADAARGTVVVCGSGNNGGDGWAIARWLHLWGLPVAVWALGEPRPGGDAATMAAVARRAGVREVAGLGEAGLVVDAIFGTGLAREVDGAAADAIRAMDGRVVVAVDLPSGLDADTGRVLGVCPTAARTVTFARAKVGMFAGEGPDRCGEVEVVDIGLDAGTPPGALAAAWIPSARDLRWPVRRPTDHKNRSGHLLVVAGSAAMAGAAVLACRGALAGGAGLVTLLAPRGARPRLGALPPEVMVLDGGEGDVLAALPDTARFDALAVGPGLGGGHPLPPALAEALAALWRDDPRPVVFDADALPCTGPSERPRVLTPHPGEAARLLGHPVTDRLAAATTLSARGVALLKGRYTVIAARGALPSINPTGGAALATGGTGDVLTGLVGALLARGLPPADAARAGAWVHGRAGERLAARRRDGWTASDVAAEVPEAAAELG